MFKQYKETIKSPRVELKPPRSAPKSEAEQSIEAALKSIEEYVTTLTGLESFINGEDKGHVALKGLQSIYFDWRQKRKKMARLALRLIELKFIGKSHCIQLHSKR